MKRRTLHRLLLSLMLTVSAVAVTLAPTTAAHADTYPPVTFLMQKEGSDYCLEARNDGSVTSGRCSHPQTVARQRIQVVRYPGTSYVYLVSAATGNCVFPDGYGTDAGTPMVQTSCGDASAKHWTMQRSSPQHENEYSVQFINRKSGRCLRQPRLGDTPDLGGSCSSWYLTPTGYNYTFRPLSSAKCLDVDTWPDGGRQHGARIQQWTCLGAGQANQLWNIEVQTLPGFNGGFRPAEVMLHPQHNPTACLVHQQFHWNGALIEQNSCGIDSAWRFYPVDLAPENQAFKLDALHLHAAPPMCLDVKNAALVDGTAVQLMQCDAAFQPSQRWRVVRVSP